jgi:hypothetical protein
MASIRMTPFTRAPNGDWFAGKMVPEDIRGAYKAAFGVSQEAPLPFPRRNPRRASEAGVQGLGC